MKEQLKNMKLINRNVILFLFAISIFSTSCGDDGDTTNPTVEISSPNNGDAFTVDDVIDIVGRATDDVALQSLNISSNLGVNEDITTFEDSSDFPFNVSLTLDPATTAGEYSISLLATDSSGNTAESEVNIEIQ